MQVRESHYFDFPAEDFRDFEGALRSTVDAAGLSPSTPLRGQILKAGHFWHPATMAIGQTVMTIPVSRVERRSMPAHENRK